jgi:hypothetical protein
VVAVRQQHRIERMSGPSPVDRLDLLRFARRVVEQQARDQLAQIDRWIADEERRQTEQENAAARRPPTPDWIIERGLNARHAVYVHAGGCHMTGKRIRPVTEGQARQALAESVDACPHCRPDTALGVLD